MRVLQYILVLAMVLGMGAYVHHERKTAQALEEARDATHTAVQRLQRQIQLKTVLNRTAESDRIHPPNVSPDWFDGDVPRNVLLGRGRPWIELAPESQRDLNHPPHPIATDAAAAEFWYNPYRGVIRARVPATLADADALQTYNFINDTDLRNLLVRP